MPLTQLDLADITGLTPVHVNRTLQEMRNLGLIELRSKWLRIPDLARLRQIAVFDESYLSLTRRRDDLPALSAAVSQPTLGACSVGAVSLCLRRLPYYLLSLEGSSFVVFVLPAAVTRLAEPPPPSSPP